jgi:hypothetical protein
MYGMEIGLLSLPLSLYNRKQKPDRGRAGPSIGSKTILTQIRDSLARVSAGDGILGIPLCHFIRG